jgi:hypothetical protein
MGLVSFVPALPVSGLLDRVGVQDMQYKGLTEARRRLVNHFVGTAKKRNLVASLINEISFGKLSTALQCWQELYAELESSEFASCIRIINEACAGTGVIFGMAFMPGSSAESAAEPCICINLQAKSRTVLLPMNRELLPEVCKTSNQFLGSHYWMEPLTNESPDLLFRQIVAFLCFETMSCPPPLTGGTAARTFGDMPIMR